MPLAICVPARDEDARLPHLLASLERLDRSGTSPVVCFLLDGCEDGSADLLSKAAGSFPFPLRVRRIARGREPNAGRARRAAMAMGLAAVGRERGTLLLSTDADSRPRADWLQAAVEALAQADVVAGRIDRRTGEDDAAQARIERYLDRLHGYRRAIDPVGWDHPTGHHYVGGANLAVHAGAYAAIGGFRPLPHGEDATLLDDAARAGLRVRRDPAMVVETSSRRVGRAPGGLAAALRALDGGEAPRVAHPHAAAWQYETQAAARRCFEAIELSDARAAFGASIGLSADHVLGVARDCPNAEAFAMRVVPAPPGGDRLVTLAEAEQALAVLEAARLERAA